MSIKLNLSLHQDEVYKKRSEIERQLMEQEVSELPEIEEGDVSIDAIYTVNWEENIEIGFYLRNATPNRIFFAHTPIKILTLKGEELTSKSINLSDMGDIPPYSVRPWRFYLEKNDPALNESLKDLKISFNSGSVEPYIRVIEDKTPAPLNEEQLKAVSEYIKTLPPVQDGAVNVNTYCIEKEGDHSLKVTILLRHKLPKPALLARFQLGIVEANSLIVARAAFEIEHYVLEPGMFLLRTFTFPPETILNPNPDIANCSIAFL